MSCLRVWFALVAAVPLFCVAAGNPPPPTVRLATDAAVRIENDDARMQFVTFDALEGGYVETVNEHAERVAGDNSIGFRLVRGAVLGAGRATLRGDPKGMRLNHDFIAHTELRLGAIGYLLKLRAAPFAGLEWKADDQPGVFPAKPERTSLGGGEGLRNFSFAFRGGHVWTLAFAKPVRYTVIDARRHGRDEFEVRFATDERVNLLVGKGTSATCLLSCSAGKAVGGARDFCGIWEGKDWVKLTVVDGIRPTSALDFIRSPIRKTPAGSEGRLQSTTNGTFRFARREEEVRFFGCRASESRFYVDRKKGSKKDLDYPKDLSRYGYNAIRVKHPEARILKLGVKGLQCDDELASRFDQFMANAAREGLYTFFEPCSPRQWKWSDLALPAPGGKDPSPALAAALCLADSRATEAWKRVMREFYGRKNKVVRKNYPEDVAIPLVVPLSDSTPLGVWNDLRTLPFMRAAYGQWLAAKRRQNPDFMKDRVCEEQDFNIMPLHEQRAGSIRLFLAEAEANGLGRMREYFTSLKGKALVGLDGGAWGYRDVAPVRAKGGDFTCESFAIDPPRALGERGSAPWRISNLNPLSFWRVPGSIANHDQCGVPFCLTSWTSQGPSCWRAATGLLVGAWAGKRGWDGVWNATDPLADPMTAVLDRAVYALYARGDMTPAAPEDALKIEKGALVVKTPRTVGGFTPDSNGQILVGPLSARLKGAMGAVWVSSLTDAPVEKSRRLLLVHLTEMQTAGTLFADARRDLMMRRGTGPMLVRDGTAEIELATEKPFAFKVYPLVSDGTRLSRIPSEAHDGCLRFTAAVRGAKNAQYMYELVRD